MEIHSPNDEIPVEIVNRNLLLYKRNSYYYSKPSYKPIKCKPYTKSYYKKECKRAREEAARRAREKREKEERKMREREREERKKKEREKEERKKKEKEEEERKKKEREEEERKKKERDRKKKEKKPPPPPNNDNNDPNNPNNPNNPNINPNNPYNPTNPYNQSMPPFISPTNGANPTSMPEAVPALPAEDRTKISVAGISVITAILIGIAALVGLAVYRKRYNLRRGAVRLYDEPDQDDSSVEPRYLSSISNMRSLRVPSMPPKVQLTRLSSATILFPFRFNSPTPSPFNNVNKNQPSPLNNNNVSNNYLSPTSPTHNNLNNNYLSPPTNNYLSPYTRVHPQPSSTVPSSSLSSGTFTISDYQGPESQKTDSMQSIQSYPSSHESYTSLESSFPIPPQRAISDNFNNTASTSAATFGDMYKLKVI